jgi:SAM-dependent methyltransferase
MTNGSAEKVAAGNRRSRIRPVEYSALAVRQQQEGSASGVACPVCLVAPAQQMFTKESYPVYRCGGCGCEFLEPQPDDSTLARIYNAHYFLGDHDEASDRRVAALKSATSRLYLDRLAPALAGNGTRLLEIGCGTGDLLVQAQARAFEVHGVEYSTAAASTANQRLGAELVRQGTIENTSLPVGYFDLVAACDVIEHTRDPNSFLERAHALLRPGGLILLVTPSLDSWSRRILGSRWMEYKVEHLFYFGQRSLTRLLMGVGFKSPVFASNRKMLSLDYLHDHFERFPVTALTPLFGILRRLAPERLAHRLWCVPASGVFVTARKPVAEKIRSLETTPQ